MKETPAWLINIGTGRIVGAGERELLHLVEHPELFEVPLAPHHCRHVLAWQGQLLPVWDLHAWLEGESSAQTTPLVVIVGYQLHHGEMPKFGGITLLEPPQRTYVADSQVCPLPSDVAGWCDIALTAFMHQDQAVPILDLPRMFSRCINARC